MPATHSLNSQVRVFRKKAIIDLIGEINGLAEHELSDAYDQAVSASANPIVLNFSQVEYINSTGIALIVGLLAKARKARIKVAVFGLSAHYQEIFEITRLVDFMDIFPDEASALSS
jgi:anti-sigma B factor antagonist